MQAARLPLSYGWGWILQGWTLFKRQPMTMLFWSLMTNLLINLNYIIPILGQIALVMATPTFGFIALNACRHIEKNQTVQLNMWLKPLRAPETKKAMFRLGAAYFICCLLAGFMSVMPFTEQIISAISADPIDPQAVNAAVQKPMFVFILFYIGISILFWHAPALMGWHHIPLKKALFYSIVACWRTKGALVVFGLFWGISYYLLHQLTYVLIQSFSLSTAQFILTPINLLFMSILYSCLYPIYRSVFGHSARINS